MFKFIFDIITDPLGLPIDCYYEWFILTIIGIIAYMIAYQKVGDLYHDGFISGGAEGSFFHWIIRAICFVVMWAVTYGVIWIGKFVILHKIQVAIGIGGIAIIVLVLKLLIWYEGRNKLVKSPEEIESDEKQ